MNENILRYTVEDKAVNYDALWIDRLASHGSSCDVHIILPVRGRTLFTKTVLRSLNRMDKCGMDVRITVVEHDSTPMLKEIAQDAGASHYWIRCKESDHFNKCLCMNVGVLRGPKSPLILFHDSDLVVNSNFLSNLMKYPVKNRLVAIQAFRDRRVLNCDLDLTMSLIVGDVSADELSYDHEGVSNTNKGQAPGGSIMVSRDLFFLVGGFDPELFHSYSPEDVFFWDKMSLYTSVMSCDNPGNEVYHLHHALQQKNNPDFDNMMTIYRGWQRMSVDAKKAFCVYKSNLISKYK